MTTPPGWAPQGVRARDADRQTVIDALSEAHANGQLTFDEYEERSRAASAAVTLQQLAPMTTDLQNAPTLEAPPRAVTSPRFAMDGVPPASTQRRLVMGLVGLGVLAVIAMIVMLIVAAAVKGDSPFGDTSAELHTADGFADFVSHLNAEFGTTEVDRVVVYPDYAVVTIPVADEPNHLESIYYDGSFDEPSAAGTRAEDDALVDVASIDGGVLTQLVDQAPAALGVPEADSVYAIIEAWGDPVQPALSVYASDEYDGGYLIAATDGHLLGAYPAGE